MKKIFAFSLAIAALLAVSCQKEKAPVAQNKTVTVNATFEPVGAADTKLTIAESGSTFALNFDGTETMVVANGTESATSNFTIASYSGTTATFTGTLPATTATTTDYYGVISTFGSATTSSPAKIRAAIAYSQDYDGANIAKNCCLVAKAANCEVGNLTSLSFKTMNAFLKLSLLKGAAASGSSNDYTAGMNVQNIVVETVNGENISGRFGILKSDDFTNPVFTEEVKDNVFPKVTLNCATSDKTNGVGLSSTATDFYIAIKPGTYEKGLKVTINVKNTAGKDGQFVRYISKNTSFDVARNTMVDMDDLTVNPTDAASSLKSYVKVTSAPTDWSGTYALGIIDGDKAKIWTGVDATSCFKDYTITGGEISGEDIVSITVAKFDTGYSIKINGGAQDGKYLDSSESTTITYSNAFKFNATEKNPISFSLDTDGNVQMSQTVNKSGADYGKKLYILYNKTSGQYRYRFYKDANLGGSNYGTPALFKLK